MMTVPPIYGLGYPPETRTGLDERWEWYDGIRGALYRGAWGRSYEERWYDELAYP